MQTHMTQTQINTLHNDSMYYIQMYASGLITLLELTNHIKIIGTAIDELKIDNLIDPATGLSIKSWKHNAPYNPQFLGAQPARSGKDY
jgi:hypothetical protein